MWSKTWLTAWWILFSTDSQETMVSSDAEGPAGHWIPVPYFFFFFFDSPFLEYFLYSPLSCSMNKSTAPLKFTHPWCHVYNYPSINRLRIWNLRLLSIHSMRKLTLGHDHASLFKLMPPWNSMTIGWGVTSIWLEFSMKVSPQSFWFHCNTVWKLSYRGKLLASWPTEGDMLCFTRIDLDWFRLLDWKTFVY